MSNTTTDPVADFLTRVRNAISVRQNQVELPHSKIKEEIAKILKQQQLIEEYSVKGKGIDKSLTVVINLPSESPRITEIVRLSKPGRRYYVKADKIPKVKSGRGLVIISTSKGLMTGKTANEQRIGGELICQVY